MEDIRKSLVKLVESMVDMLVLLDEAADAIEELLRGIEGNSLTVGDCNQAHAVFKKIKEAK